MPAPLNIPTTQVVTHKHHQNSRVPKLRQRKKTISSHRFRPVTAIQRGDEDSCGRTAKDLRPPRVRQQADDAGEEAGEEHDPADADAGTPVRNGSEADDGSDEEDGTEGDGDEGAGALDAVGRVVEDVALGPSFLLGGFLLDLEEPSAIRLQEEIQPVRIGRCEGHEVVFVVEEVLVSSPERQRRPRPERAGGEPSLEVFQRPR